MLSIKATAGGPEYDLPVLTPAVRDRLQSWYDNGGFEELINPDAGLIGTDDDEPRCRVGSVLWPVVGATRFARAVLPIDSYTLGLLRLDLGSLVAEADGTPLLDETGAPLLADARAAVTLSFQDDPTDPAETPRTIDLFLIASRPVSRTTDDPFPSVEPAEDDLWLITLVDQRYYWVHSDGSGLPEWWDASAPDYTWDQVFSALFARVGSSHTIDAVDGAYTDPTERWGCKSAQASSTAFLLDYAAQCVGSRIVMVPGSAPAVQRPLAAYRTDATTWHAAQVADDRFAGGGLLDSDELLGGIPGAVRGSFQDDTSVTVYLATGMTGHTIEAWHDCAAWRSARVKTTHITQWAADWYTWQDSPLDAVYSGFVLPPQSGFLGSVEWYHDSVVGYTRVQRPWQGWVNPPDWRPDSFPAALGSTYGARGYEWARKVQKKLIVSARGVSGGYAVEVNGRTDLQPGLVVEMFAECFGCGVSFEYNPPCAGCNLTYDSSTNCYKVNVPSLAGSGLTTVLSGDCYQLQVDAAFLPPTVTIFGCGLVVTGGNTLKVDLSAAVHAPLVWTGCSLDLNISCGLTTDGITGALKVDNATLVGSAFDTGLVVGDGCELAVDTDVVRTVNWRRDNITFFGRTAGGKLKLCYSIFVDTDEYNAKDMLINHVLGDGANTCIEVDVCDPACCSDCTISFAVSASPTSGSAPLTTTLSIDTLSGCTSPYTVYVNWGDGTIDTLPGAVGPFTVNHTYNVAGTYTIDAYAEDTCGFASAIATVNVTATAGSACTGFNGVALYVTTVSSGGPSNCLGSELHNDAMSATSSTTQAITHGAGCAHLPGDPDGFAVTVICVGDGTYQITHDPCYSGPPLASGFTSSGGPPGSGTFQLTRTYTDGDTSCTPSPKTITVYIRDYTV